MKHRHVLPQQADRKNMHMQRMHMQRTHLAGISSHEVPSERLFAVLPEAARGGVRDDLVVQALVAECLTVGVLAHCRHAVHGRVCDVLDLHIQHAPVLPLHALRDL
jgi:hypothetical protein